MFKKTLLTVSCLTAAALFAENQVRNGAFEYQWKMNGANMQCGPFDVGNRLCYFSAFREWLPTPFEGWWLHTAKDSSPILKDCGGFLRMTGSRYAVCSTPQPMQGKQAVLSIDVRALNAKAKVVFEGVELGENKERKVVGEKKVEIPYNTNRKWERLEIPFDGIPGSYAAVRIEFENGQLDLDNVQIEEGLKATAFDVRSGDKLELSIGKYTAEHFPRFYQGRSGEMHLRILNRSRVPMNGTLYVYLDQWQHAGETLFKEIELKDFNEKGVIFCKINPGELPPDGYVVLAEVRDKDGNVLVSKDIFDGTKPATGVTGEHMFSAHNGMRFGVFKDMEPQKLFGAGNGLVGIWGWYSGARPLDFAETKPFDFTGFIGGYTGFMGGHEDELFNAAIGGAEMFLGNHQFDAADYTRPELNNPAIPGSLDYNNPEARKLILERAEELGKLFAEGPGFNGLKIRNEAPYPGGGGTYPTAYADKAFREWVKNRYKTLDAVNLAWNKNYSGWDEVEQIVSSRMAQQETTVTKTGSAAVDWYAHMGTLNEKVAELMQNDPARAMDWCRWRSDSSKEMYTEYIKAVQKWKPGAVVGVNQPWPDFWPQIFMPLWRVFEAPMLDVQYASHMTIDLGNSEEMIDILEMADSVAKGKPIWGIEIYVQPTFHPDYAPLQNWGMLAHGMTHTLVFGWKPYADVGPDAFKDGPGAWKKPSAPPMWLLIDIDGTKLPSYYTNMRSVREIQSYHKRFDGHSVKRMPTRVGYYLSNDQAEFIIFTTTNKPFQSSMTNAHVTMAAQMRWNGASLDYFDDDALLGMKNRDYDTIIVPPSPVMSNESIEKLAAFAKDGGTVVLLGPCAVYDPLLRVRKEYADGKLSAPGWTVPEKWSDYKAFLKDYGTYTEIGLSTIPGLAALPDSTEIRDSKNKVVGSSAKLGKGKVLHFTTWPCRYEFENVHPSAELRLFAADLVRILNLPRKAYWETPDTPELKGFGRPGNGAPLVEVVLREKSAKERFLFVLNQGGAGKGTVVLDESGWMAEDVITGIPAYMDNGRKLQLDLPAFGYRVFRLTR